MYDVKFCISIKIIKLPMNNNKREYLLSIFLYQVQTTIKSVMQLYSFISTSCIKNNDFLMNGIVQLVNITESQICLSGVTVVFV